MPFTANFALPEEGTLFDKVEFVELDRAEAAKLVEKYNKEGRDALPPAEKRFRENRFSGGIFLQQAFLLQLLLISVILL